MALFPWLFISFYLDRFQLIKILVRTCVFKHRNRMWASSGLSPCEKRCSPHFLTTGPSACPCPSYRSPIGEPRLIQVGIRSLRAASVLRGKWAHRAAWPSPARGPGTKDCRDPVRFWGRRWATFTAHFQGFKSPVPTVIYQMRRVLAVLRYPSFLSLRATLHPEPDLCLRIHLAVFVLITFLWERGAGMFCNVVAWCKREGVGALAGPRWGMPCWGTSLV